MAVLGLSREVRVGLIAILVPIIVLLDDNHAPLAGVEEAPLSTPSPLLGGSEGSYWAAGYALGAPGADGAVVQLRYAFGDLGSAAPFAQPLQLDEETRDWVSARHASAVPTWISLSYGVVKLFCYKWVAGALFQQPELFLLSAAQWEALLRPWVQPPSEEGSIRTTALDVGAGTGWVTARYSHLFGEVVTTEVAVRPALPSALLPVRVSLTQVAGAGAIHLATAAAWLLRVQDGNAQLGGAGWKSGLRRGAGAQRARPPRGTAPDAGGDGGAAAAWRRRGAVRAAAHHAARRGAMGADAALGAR